MFDIVDVLPLAERVAVRAPARARSLADIYQEPVSVGKRGVKAPQIYSIYKCVRSWLENSLFIKAATMLVQFKVTYFFLVDSSAKPLTTISLPPSFSVTSTFRKSNLQRQRKTDRIVLQPHELNIK